MKLSVSRKNGVETYSVKQVSQTQDGKRSTKTVERLGTIDDLKARFGEDDPVGAAKKYVAELTAAEDDDETICVSCQPEQLMKKNEQHLYNGGYLFVQKIYYDLGLPSICQDVLKRQQAALEAGNIECDLNEYLQLLVYARALNACTQMSPFDEAALFIDPPKPNPDHDIALLALLTAEARFVQAQVYHNSLKVRNRNTQVLYYVNSHSGLTESIKPYYMEAGLFTDADGLPLAFCVEPGKLDEQAALKLLGEILNDNFENSKLIISTGSGRPTKNLPGDDKTVVMIAKKLKKLKTYIQEWSYDLEDYDLSGFIEDCYTEGYFVVSFLVLLILEWLEAQVNVGSRKFTSQAISETLVDMNFHLLIGVGYIPLYVRTTLTDLLHKAAGFRTDTEIVLVQTMQEIINDTKSGHYLKTKK